MTREEAKKYIKENFGVEEPTDEQISSLLNKMNDKKKDEIIADLKDKVKDYDDVKKQLDEINESKMTEVEKANKAVEASNKTIADLQKQITVMQRKNDLAKIGIVGEDADKLFKADGSLDIDIVGKIITDREAQAKALAKEELLDKTPDLKGKQGGGDEDNKIDDLTKSVVNGLKRDSKESADIINNYKA